ncbi:hypothetical protein ID741_003867 [Enterococcus sp. AZ103]
MNYYTEELLFMVNSHSEIICIDPKKEVTYYE